MYQALLVITALLPAAILLYYFDKQDRGREEPFKLKWNAFWWGVFIIVPAVIIGVGLEQVYQHLGVDKTEDFWLYVGLTSFITAALLEESLKLSVVHNHFYHRKEFNEFMDGITYAVIVSLGFAAFENVLYVLDGGLLLALGRAIISVPAHALFSGIMGFYIGKSRFTKSKGERRKLILLGLSFAVLYHGAFNFVLFSKSNLIYAVVPIILLMAWQLKRLISKAQIHDKLPPL